MSLHSVDPPFLKGGRGVNFKYLPRRMGGSQKSKREWKYGAGAGLLKRGGGGGMVGLALFLFSFFKVYHFYI